MRDASTHSWILWKGVGASGITTHLVRSPCKELIGTPYEKVLHLTSWDPIGVGTRDVRL